jgi:HPt (histidine-containing phosphotransfer) domain-containing protein
LEKSKLERIFAADSEGQLRRLLLARTLSDLGTMRRAIAGGEPDVVARLCHRLRGAAGSLGFDRLSEIAGELERAAKSSPAASLSKLVEELKDEVGRVSADAGGEERP